MKNQWFYWVIPALFLVGCVNEPSEQNEFDRGPILENIGMNQIMPTYEDFVTKTTELGSKTDQFIASGAASDLVQLQAAWVEAKLSWKQCEIFNFGPVASRAYENEIDLWPTDVAGIEAVIETYTGVNSLVTIGSNKKGLSAIEYLLFHGHDSSIIAEFQSEKRQQYLADMVYALRDIAAFVYNEWQNGYLHTFTTSIGNDVGSSTTLIANEMIFLLEVIKNYKVATPLGFRSEGKLPEKVESYFAGQSIPCIQQNLASIHRVFTGTDGPGFDDYLNDLGIADSDGKLLSETIIEQINACISSANAIEGSLSIAVIEETATVEKLFVDLQQLTVLLKTDMMSQLGLVVTFSDNDGD